MRILGHRILGSGRRLAVYLEEKGIEIPFESIDLMAGDHRKPEFLAKNPAGLIPVLELDDGTCIAETVAIARYLESLHPDPPFFGRNALECAHLEMWQRIVEFGFYSEARAFYRHTHPALVELEPVQVAAWGELSGRRAAESLELLDRQLANHEFIAGSAFSWADILVVTTVQSPFGAFEIPGGCTNVMRWYEAVSVRPSVLATTPGAG